MSSQITIRRYLRLVAYLPVRCTTLSRGHLLGKVIAGKTKFISPGGLGLLPADIIPLRTDVLVQVSQGEPLRARIIWHDRPRSTDLQTSILHGVAFDHPVNPDQMRQWVISAQRQSHPRVPVRFDVEFTHAGQADHGTCVNLSRGGMFIATNRPPHPGTELLLRFKLQDPSETLSIPAGVAWTRGEEMASTNEEKLIWLRGEETWPGTLTGMGVMFLEVKPFEASLIGTVLDRLRDRTNMRRVPRIPCDLPTEYEVEGVGLCNGHIRNIAIGGLLLNSSRAIPEVGSDLRLCFSLPTSNRPVATVGKVRWTTDGRAGVEFVQLGQREQDEIYKYYATESASQAESHP